MMERIEFPSAFVERMKTQLGDEAPAFFETMQRQPSACIRLNPAKVCPLPAWCAESAPVEWCPTGRRLAERPVFTAAPQLHQGAFYAQEAASMVYEPLVRALAGSEPVRYLDLCAAPGGKTTAASAALPEGSLLVANEYVAARAATLCENLVKWGVRDIVATCGDTARFRRLEGVFDIVAVDAPCSGEGMMRKEPEAVRQWTPGLTGQCAALQSEILDNAWAALRPGGYLIYSTCTFSTAENEDQAIALMERKGAVSALPELTGTDAVRRNAGSLDFLQFMPHRAEAEGLFVCVLRKPGDAPPATPKKGRGTAPWNGSGAPSWLRAPDGYALFAEDDVIVARRPGLAPLMNRIAGCSRPMMFGVRMAVRKGRDYVPDHQGVMCGMFRGALPEVEVDLETASAYLRREAPLLPPDTPKGYVTLTYGGLPLGLVKNLGIRANNLYPKSYRVLGRWT